MAHPAVLPLTGERTVPGVPEENYWFRRHEAAYEFVLPIARRLRVLEVGCGEGYGTARIGSVACSVLGIDYDALTIAHASATYPSVRFARGNLAALPVPSGSVDLVVTLQVIEHVWNHREFVAECRRVLRPGGRLIVSTPNRLTFSPGLESPVNPFHTVEFTAAELASLVASGGFAVSDVYGLRAGARLVASDAAYGGSFVAAQLATPPSSWPARLWADVGVVTTADFPIVSSDVDSSLDLVLSARRV